jgi:hypothetical protein
LDVDQQEKQQVQLATLQQLDNYVAWAARRRSIAGSSSSRDSRNLLLLQASSLSLPELVAERFG